MRASTVRSKRRFLFWRLGGFLFLISVILAISLLIAVALVGGGLQNGAIAGAVWIGGCASAIVLAMIGFWLAGRSFRSFASPLAEVMAAADALAEGDLSTRVPERIPGEMGRLALSFNRMAEELERAEERRRNLTAEIAHELRTPLHIIQGNLEGILDGVYPADARQIEVILDETRLLSRLIEDLHTLSLAESGRLPLHIVSVDVGDLLEDVVTSFSPQASEAGIRLEARLPEQEKVQIEADPDRLDQILSNLVSNAIRHTPQGGEIVLEASQTGEMVTIMVADTGEGIPAKDLPYIFERFWRADSARTRGAQSGSGLGLAIVEKLVQMHSGSVQVSSQPDMGTIFEIDLPKSAHEDAI